MVIPEAPIAPRERGRGRDSSIEAVPKRWGRRRETRAQATRTCFPGSRWRAMSCGCGKGSSSQDRESEVATRRGFGLYITKREISLQGGFAQMEDNVAQEKMKQQTPPLQTTGWMIQGWSKGWQRNREGQDRTGTWARFNTEGQEPTTENRECRRRRQVRWGVRVPTWRE